MQRTAVVLSKVALPRRHAYLSRAPLVERLRGVLDARLALVCADAGYGKATLLVEFMKPMAPNAVVYRLEKSDRDPVVFLTYLSAALAPLCANGSREMNVASFHLEAAAPDLRHLLGVLLEEYLQKVTAETVLALDDYHYVDESPEIATLVEDLVELSPPNFHFVIATRARPRLPLHRWRAQGVLIELTEAELAFTSGEVKALFRDLYRHDISDSLLEVLHARTEGWAAGLALVHHCLKGKGEPETLEFLERLDGSTRSVYEYLAGEVFQNQPEEIKGFLCATSLLTRLSGPLCDRLLGRNDSDEILRYLERNGLFTFALDEHESCYRYHRLFKGFLRSRLVRQMGEAGAAALHERLGELLVQQGESGEAIAHYFHAGLYPRAVELVLAEAENLLASGRIDTLLHHLRQIPRAFGAVEPWLLYYEALVLRLQDNPQAAWPLQHEALQHFRDRGDTRGEASVLLEIGMLCHFMGRPREGIEALRGALSQLPPGEPLLHARILAGLVNNYMVANEFRQAVALGEEALLLLQPLDTDPGALACRVQLLRNLAWTYMHMGEIVKALDAASEAHRLQQSQGRDDRATTRNLHTVGVVMAARGELGVAIPILEEALRLARKHRMGLMAHNIEAALGLLHCDCGDFATSERYYEMAGNPVTGYANIGFYYFRRGFLYVAQRRYGDAARVAREALKVAIGGGSAGDLGTVYTLLGVLHREEGDCEGARFCLEKAEEIFADVGFLYRVASVRLHLARLHYLLGQDARAEGLLREALAFARSKGFHHFAYWHAETMAFVLARALEAGIETEYVRSFFHKRLGPRDCRQLIPLPSRPELAERVGAIVGGLFAGTQHAAEVGDAMLAECSDGAVREHIMDALSAGEISVRGLSRLRGKHELTWREIQVFIHYYLKDHQEKESPGFRRQRAMELGMSDNTLKCHISSLRRKLGLHSRVGVIDRRSWREP